MVTAVSAVVAPAGVTAVTVGATPPRGRYPATRFAVADT